MPRCGLGLKAQLQALFYQTGQARSLLRGKRLGVGKQPVVDIQGRLHDEIIGNSVCSVTPPHPAGILEINHALVSRFKLNYLLHTILETMYRDIDFRQMLLCTRDATNGMMQDRSGVDLNSQGLTKRFSFEIASAPDIFCAVTSKGIDSLIRNVSDLKIENRAPEWCCKAVDAESFRLLPVNIKVNSSR